MPSTETGDNFLKYNPGSPDAVERGCTSPAAENNLGRGRSKNGADGRSDEDRQLTRV